MSLPLSQYSNCSTIFGKASGIADKPKKKVKAPTPFAIRFSDEERIYLKELAGSKPLGTFIRDIVLSDKVQKRRPTRQPSIDEKQLSVVLSALGQSRLSSNLNQLAKHANVGTLDVSQDIEQQLEDACGAVIAMRDALMIALGQRPKGHGD